MLNFDEAQSRASPLSFELNLNVSSTIKADDAAKAIANCFAALQSLATTRPVTVTPFVQMLADKEKSVVKITLEPIVLSDTMDFTKLALLSDPRTLRQFIVGAYMDGESFTPTKSIPIDRSAKIKSITVTDSNFEPTTYEQASENIARLIQLQDS
jgi:hypothetical protein